MLRDNPGQQIFPLWMTPPDWFIPYGHYTLPFGGLCIFTGWLMGHWLWYVMEQHTGKLKKLRADLNEGSRAFEDKVKKLFKRNKDYYEGDDSLGN